MHLMKVAFFLKTNQTIIFRASSLVRSAALYTCNSELHEVIYASTSSGRDASYSENEMFACIAPCRERKHRKLHGIRFRTEFRYTPHFSIFKFTEVIRIIHSAEDPVQATVHWYVGTAFYDFSALINKK
jgi:hypothetical protein